MGNRTISWPRSVRKQFGDIIIYISANSTAGAEKISTGILEQLYMAAKNPRFFPPDKNKQNNDGSYRAFEKYHYRVAYRYTDKIIKVLSVKHTGMKQDIY